MLAARTSLQPFAAATKIRKWHWSVVMNYEVPQMLIPEPCEAKKRSFHFNPPSFFLRRWIMINEYLDNKPEKREAQFCQNFNFFGWFRKTNGKMQKFLDRKRNSSARSRCICIMA